MNVSDLRTRYGLMLREHDAKLDALEKEEQRLGGELRRGLRALFVEAGEPTCVAAGYEETEAFLNAFPKKSELPDDVPLVEYNPQD
jgi:hypothetical protein